MEFVEFNTYRECNICERYFLKLHIHHINGIHQDDREENRILICPNCHTKIHNGLSKNMKLLHQRKIELFNKINEYRKKISPALTLLPNEYSEFAL